MNVDKETKAHNDAIRSKIIMAKASLPFRSVALKFVESHQEYNTAEMYSKVGNMLNGRSLNDTMMINKFLNWAKQYNDERNS